MFITDYVMSRIVDLTVVISCSIKYLDVKWNFFFVSFYIRKNKRTTKPKIKLCTVTFYCVRTSNIDYNTVRVNIAKIHKYKTFYLQRLQDHL